MTRTKRESILSLFEYYCDGGYGAPDYDLPSTYQMGACKTDYNEKTNVLSIWVRRPGILIGKRGRSVDKIKELLECEIHIHEVKQLWEEKEEALI